MQGIDASMTAAGRVAPSQSRPMPLQHEDGARRDRAGASAGSRAGANGNYARPGTCGASDASARESGQGGIGTPAASATQLIIACATRQRWPAEGARARGECNDH